MSQMPLLSTPRITGVLKAMDCRSWWPFLGWQGNSCRGGPGLWALGHFQKPEKVCIFRPANDLG